MSGRILHLATGPRPQLDVNGAGKDCLKSKTNNCRGDKLADQVIITTADMFDAITAVRPYRNPIPQALEMMSKAMGTALDPDCFAALVRAVETVHFPTAAQESGRQEACVIP